MLYIYKDKYGIYHVSKVKANAEEYAVGEILEVGINTGRKLEPTDSCETLLKKAAKSLGV